jgi:TfoX/Sxy family transcriptional regulator of competence genes
VAYDTEVADRIRARIGPRPGLTERQMFGGIAFMINGNMAVGVSGEELMVRVGEESHEQAVAQPGARTFDMGARPMKGWISVTDDGYDSEEAFGYWIDQGLAYAESLPAK